MKAGIYKTPNGNLIYVRKDRAIAATAAAQTSWIGEKVKSFNDGGHVWIFPSDSAKRITAFRVADVPNGRTEPGKALCDYADAIKARDAYREKHPEIAEAAKGFADGGVIHSSPINEGEVAMVLSRGLVVAESALVSIDIAEHVFKGIFYSGGIVPKPGDYLVKFVDQGQDVLRWTLREEEDGYTRVIESLPHQGSVWVGCVVHNAERVFFGKTRLLNISTPHGNGPGDFVHTVEAITRIAPERKIGMPAELGMGYEQFANRAHRETEKPRRVLIVDDREASTNLLSDLVKQNVLIGGRLPMITSRAASLLQQGDAAHELAHTIHANALRQGFVDGIHDEMVRGESFEVREMECLDSPTMVRDTVIRGPVSNYASFTGHADALPLISEDRRYQIIEHAKMETERFTAEGWNVCHRQSARKHRKQGDQVIESVFVAGRFYWRPGLKRAMTVPPTYEAGEPFDPNRYTR